MNVLKMIPPIHIHPIMFVFILLGIVTGTFVHLWIIFSIVLFHELGHYMMARFFGWRIKGIVLWVFGGVMETDEHTTRPLYEEILVTIAGPFQHVFIFWGISLVSGLDIFPTETIGALTYYNTIILLFNLLPIWPLDGGKLMLIALSAKWPYKKAHQMTIIVSVLLIFFIGIGYMIIAPFTLGIYMIALFLIIENRLEWKRRSYMFIRFLLNRYENHNTINAVTSIEVPSHSSVSDVFVQFKREKRHYIYVVFPDQTRRMVDETECLRSYFHDKRHDLQMADMAYWSS